MTGRLYCNLVNNERDDLSKYSHDVITDHILCSLKALCNNMQLWSAVKGNGKIYCLAVYATIEGLSERTE